MFYNFGDLWNFFRTLRDLSLVPFFNERTSACGSSFQLSLLEPSNPSHCSGCSRHWKFFRTQVIFSFFLLSLLANSFRRSKCWCLRHWKSCFLRLWKSCFLAEIDQTRSFPFSSCGKKSKQVFWRIKSSTYSSAGMRIRSLVNWRKTSSSETFFKE